MIAIQQIQSMDRVNTKYINWTWYSDSGCNIFLTGLPWLSPMAEGVPAPLKVGKSINEEAL